MRTLPWPSPHIVHDITPGTERMRAFLSELGNPERRVPPVIHVAGTNGKGSTVQFLRAIFEAQGYRVHTYTSPHLLSWNERITIAGEQVSDAALIDALRECQAVEERSGISVSHFEGLTAAAILLFASSLADVTLVETGLGGRDDATNVWDNVLATVLTPISFDHQEFLGYSLEEIASHKAGIIKTDRPCVVALQPDAVSRVIRDQAEHIGGELFEAGRGWYMEQTPRGPVIRYQTGSSILEEEVIPEPSLLGAHQYENAATALMTCHVVAATLPTTPAARARGIRSAQWHGRLQRISSGNVTSQLPPSWQLWCDAAHNEAGAKVLGRWLASLSPRPLIVIAGCSRGRSLDLLLSQLDLPPESPIIAIEGLVNGVPVGHGASSQDTTSIPPIETVASLNAALDRASAIAAQSNTGRLIVTGSLYLVGALLELNDQ